MKEVAGIWLPDHERHLIPFLEDQSKWIDGRGSYQRHKLGAAMAEVTGFGRALDIGAHVGLWSMALAERFEAVVAFEPIQLHRRCWMRNVPPVAALHLLPYLLGEESRVERPLHVTRGSSGDTRVELDCGGGPAALEMRYDALDGADGEVDLVKLDCEGYELFALRGMEAMLRRERPCVIVEQKPGRAQRYGLGEIEAVGYLESLGARLRREISGDFILSW